MYRREFLKTTSTVIAGATLAPALTGTSALAADSSSGATGRLVLPINRNWRYSPAFVEGAHAREFDDSAFARVVVPHTNVRLPWHSFDEKLYEFVSIYRRRFKLPPEAAGSQVFVDFEGVMTASTVWINGVRLGEYKGGYTPFFVRSDAASRFQRRKCTGRRRGLAASAPTFRLSAIRSTT